MINTDEWNIWILDNQFIFIYSGFNNIFLKFMIYFCTNFNFKFARYLYILKFYFYIKCIVLSSMMYSYLII